MQDHEEILRGGSTNQVVKIGETVHRQNRGGAVLHSYLQYLERAGMAGVPRFLGIDPQGREVLSYVPGLMQENGIPLGHPLLMSEETVAGAAAFLRRLHDASEGFLPEAIQQNWVDAACPGGRYDTICHHDAAVWNFVFSGGQVAGLIDFDEACAGTRIWDIAWSVYGVVHLHAWQYVPALGKSVPYDAAQHAPIRKRGIRLFFDAYGMDCPPDFIDTVYQRIKIGVCDDLQNKAAAGDKSAADQIKHGALKHYTRILAFVRECGQGWI